jgi:hypothetical protein
MKTTVIVTLMMCLTVVTGCRQKATLRERQAAEWSAWIEEAAAQRGYIKPGDFAEFGCPPGWLGVDDTAAALRGGQGSTRYMGTDPPPREGTLTCVAQKELPLPPPYTLHHPEADPPRRPLAPVWVDMEADRLTIGFRSELPPTAAIYIARDTPCGPRVIGVRLDDLLKWLSDPYSAPKRDFLGMISSGCPVPPTPGG